VPRHNLLSIGDDGTDRQGSLPVRHGSGRSRHACRAPPTAPVY
jgi:hypothetical protein